MSRLVRFAYGITSSYLLLAATAGFNLLTVPIALSFLDTREFGLWALAAQFGGYLQLLDFGVSAAIGRCLIDHKDDPNGGSYGSLLKTTLMVQCIQGMLIFALGWILSPLFAKATNLPAELVGPFVQLMRWQIGIVALGFPFKLFTSVLYAHQRLDTVNLTQLIQLVVSLVVLCTSFYAGAGIYSTIIAQGIGTLLVSGGTLGFARHLRLIPSAGCWGEVRRDLFLDLFDYAKEMFLISLGTQLILASQIPIISRKFGLDAAVQWTIGTKVFLLLCQIIWRISDLLAPAFSEMLVRGEIERLRDRYRQSAIISTSISVCAATIFAAVNATFVKVWTNGKVEWSPALDVLLAFWMVILALVRSHNGLILLTKDVRAMRYVYLLEGLIFVCAAIFVPVRFGLAGVLVASILASCACTGFYGVWRTAEILKVPLSDVGVRWNFRPFLTSIIAVFVCVVSAIATAGLSSGGRLAVLLATAVPATILVLLRFGVPGDCQNELALRLPASCSRYFAWAMGREFKNRAVR